MPSLEIPSGTRQRTELTLCSLMTNYSVEVPVPRFQLWDLSGRLHRCLRSDWEALSDGDIRPLACPPGAA